MPLPRKVERARKPKTGKSDANADALRQLPSLDELLRRPSLAELALESGRDLVVAEARHVLDELRAKHSRSEAAGTNAIAIETAIAESIRRALAPSLRRVINATGVVLHTNLGRAPLSPAAVERIRETAGRYTNLEYDLVTGARGRRDAHTGTRLARAIGAEATILVNNNAAAVLLVLAVLAKGREVIVSRGELVEIGSGFRIPEIMAESGAFLREVGTTNRTRAADYERAINERTALLLRVHPSNFQMTGFTERPAIEELSALGRKHSLPVFEDLGSGCLADLSGIGIVEPMARASLAAGVDVIAFSGDKLLGGPQAGIIAGRRDLVERTRRHPLFRALRADKLAIAAMEETLSAHLRGAWDEIPAQRMLRLSPNELRQRASAFVERLQPHLPAGASLEIVEGFSVIGGGSTPDQKLPTFLLAVSCRQLTSARLEERLRQPAEGIPVIARIEDGRLLLDLRTVLPDEEGLLACALVGALTDGSGLGFVGFGGEKNRA
jgi:L-seryl-tRNA(Ser) seleniumtransferase